MGAGIPSGSQAGRLLQTAFGASPARSMLFVHPASTVTGAGSESEVAGTTGSDRDQVPKPSEIIPGSEPFVVFQGVNRSGGIGTFGQDRPLEVPSPNIIQPMTPHDHVHLASTVTRLGPEVAGKVLVSGSHGGSYAGYLAAKARACAVILNDAGVGKDSAGIGSLGYCDALGMAAATVSHMSARIGDAQDTLSAGIISHANEVAHAAGCEAGMSCLGAALALRGASPPRAAPEYAEARRVIGETGAGLRLVCVDSISLVVEDEDEGQIVLSGSHGGLVAGQSHLAIKVHTAGAFFNDAGIGKDGAGITRLPVLDARGIAGATVAAMSARIGDGRSTYEDGIVSCVNETARAAGIEPGMMVRESVTLP